MLPTTYYISFCYTVKRYLFFPWFRDNITLIDTILFQLSITKYDGTLLSTKESIAVQFEINTKTGLKTINKKYYPSAAGLLRVDQTFPKEAETVTIKVGRTYVIIATC